MLAVALEKTPGPNKMSQPPSRWFSVSIALDRVGDVVDALQDRNKTDRTTANHCNDAIALTPPPPVNRSVMLVQQNLSPTGIVYKRLALPDTLMKFAVLLLYLT